MQKADFIRSYLNYRLHAITEYGVHSPFLFEFIIHVLKDKQVYPDYRRVESLKKQLLRSDEIIEVTDFGAGSKVLKDKHRSVAGIAKTSSKPKKYGRLLHRISRFLKPASILELGTSLGLSTAYMALGNQNSRIITMEGCPNIANIAKANFRQLQLDHIELVNGPFDEMLTGVLDELPELNLVFVDGNHRLEPTLAYFEQCLPKAVNETCMIFDDIHWSKEMEEAWEIIRKNPGVTLSVDLFFMGLVFFKRELTKSDVMIRF